MRALLLISLLLGSCTAAVESAEIVEEVQAPTTTALPTTTTIAPTTSSPATDPAAWYLVSVTGSLPDGFSDDLSSIEGILSVSTVRVGTINMLASRDPAGKPVDTAPEGFFVPLEAQSFRTVEHRAYVPVSVGRELMDLAHGEVLLSRTSAELRRLDPGSEIDIEDGRVLVVRDVVDDEWVGEAEIVVSERDAEALAVTNERYSVVRFRGSQAELAEGVATLTESNVRVRSRDEVDVFRHADAVPSQLKIKVRYGEFSYRPIDEATIEIDPAWVETNIVREAIPLLGTFRCHAVFLENLREAMTQLEAMGQGDAIDASSFRGCWNPRFIRNRSDLSHHAWGAAADINFGEDDLATDPRLLAAMTAASIRSGHTWSDPGPGHFEWFPDAE
ncbi:MAG: hypothetical protein ACR2N7_07305 [Acidimicrobiia bacterium]